MNRRGFVFGIAGLLVAKAAPAIVRADSLMRIVPMETDVLRYWSVDIGGEAFDLDDPLPCRPGGLLRLVRPPDIVAAIEARIGGRWRGELVVPGSRRDQVAERQWRYFAETGRNP